MRVGVIDIGSNTVRLLVADVEDGVTAVDEQREFLGLGADILRDGRISDRKAAETAATARRFARHAARLGAQRIEAVVTAPGRQGSSSAALVAAVEHASRIPVRLLSAEEEGRLAFAGAVSRAGDLPRVVAVCDVGGGSTEVAVGTPAAGPDWIRSADVGSLRLTRACLLSDPPAADEIAAARAAVREALAPLEAPRPEHALAVGGSARAAAKLLGKTLAADDLETVVTLASRRTVAKTAKAFGLEVRRAETLVAGALILAEVATRLETPFRLARGGLREGAALALAGRAETAAAAA